MSTSTAYAMAQAMAGWDNLRWNASVIADERRAREAQAAADRSLQADYDAHLRAAKRTGYMPLAYQRSFGADCVVGLVGVRECLLRELRKYAPDHPLLHSDCREMLAAITRLKYNDADRPNTVEFAAYGPSATESARVYAQFGWQEGR